MLPTGTYLNFILILSKLHCQCLKSQLILITHVFVHWTDLPLQVLSAPVWLLSCVKKMSECTNYYISQFFFSDCCRLWFWRWYSPQSLVRLGACLLRMKCHAAMTQWWQKGLVERSQECMWRDSCPALVSTSDTFNVYRKRICSVAV